ncbi:MAG: hypothetical protein R3F15_15615 [Lysobacterales bacterium]
MFRMLLSLLLLMFTLTRPALAIEDVDPRFSGDGIAIIDQGEDWPVITCPAAGGKRLLVNRTSESAITTSRLLDNGQLDPQFGTGGTAVAAVSTFPSWRYTPALCRDDGSVWIVSEVPGNGDDRNLRVFAIDANGALQASFGGAPGGLVNIDLDQSRPDLSNIEFPRAMIAMPDGGALIVGHVRVTTIGRDRPFVIKLSAQGAVQRIAFPEPAGLSESIRASAAAVGPGGGIWVVGDGYASGNRAYRMYIDPKNYAVVRTEISDDSASNVGVSSGVLLRSGVMVVAGTQTLVPGEPAQPRLFVFRANSNSFTMLPMPNPLPGTAGAGLQVQADGNGATLVAVPPDRVVLAMGVDSFANGDRVRDAGIYVGRAIIGDSIAEDRVDTAFGIGGRDGLSVPSGDPSCSGQTNRQEHAHVGLWDQRPLILGRIFGRCSPDSQDDILLLRLAPADVLLRNGFE